MELVLDYETLWSFDKKIELPGIEQARGLSFVGNLRSDTQQQIVLLTQTFKGMVNGYCHAF